MPRSTRRSLWLANRIPPPLTLQCVFLCRYLKKFEGKGLEIGPRAIAEIGLRNIAQFVGKVRIVLSGTMSYSATPVYQLCIGFDELYERLQCDATSRKIGEIRRPVSSQ